MSRRAARGLPYFVWSAAVMVLLCAQLTPSAATENRAPANSPNSISYDYDPLSDQVAVRVINRSHLSLGQSFTVTDGISEITGFRMKIRRLGYPPALQYRIGSRYGDDDIASGAIDADRVNQFFEFFYGGDFSAKTCVPGRKYFIRLSIPETADPSAGYAVYGTTTLGENPINRDYGALTPRYPGGETIDDAGQAISGVELAFEIVSGPTNSKGMDHESEPRFQFVNELLRGPHTHSVRDPSVKPTANEVAIDDSWQIVSAGERGVVTDAALTDFRRFLFTGMQVQSKEVVAESVEGMAYRRVLIVGTKEQMPVFGAGLEQSESYRIKVDGRRIIVCGFDERGIMRGLLYLEDLMSLKRAPIVRWMNIVRSPRFSPRITCLPFYAWDELDSEADPYTDEVLSLIAHYGFNAIWIGADLDDLGKSSIFPELGQKSEAETSRLNEIIARAQKHGIDVYLYLAKNPLPNEFFLKHPEVRGNQAPRYFAGHSFIMCTSVASVQKYIQEATRSIFVNAPLLKGLVFIVGGEGFYHDWTESNGASCARCRNRSPIDVVAEIVDSVDRGAKSARANAQVVVWTYGAIRTWSQNEETQARLIERLPKDVVFLAEFAKGGHIAIGGVQERTYDYSISYLGPSQKFRDQLQLCKKRGVQVWAKTESMIALEFIQTPYIPVYQRWCRRYEGLRSFPEVRGLFMNWNHFGFMPSRVSELARWYTFNPAPDGGKLLAEIARRDFGLQAAPNVVRAWDLFSHAIGYYPFSAPVALGPIQSGPALPFYFDSEYKPLHSKGRQFSNDLLWTQPWEPDLASDNLKHFEEEWSRGVDLLKQAQADTAVSQKGEIVRELGIAQAILSCVRTVLNQIQFYDLRYKLTVATDLEQRQNILDRMQDIVHREIQNSTDAAKYVEADSRLGYTNAAGATEGGSRAGIYTPAMINKKIDAMHALEADLANRRANLK
jgi:hypothetical protein